MKCPKCHNALVRYVHNIIELDFCQNCKGIWFDEGEIAQYFWTKKDLPNSSEAFPDYDDAGPKCPKGCGLLMQHAYSKGHDLIVDVCPYCKGIWLDEGEASKIDQIIAKKHPKLAYFINRACKYLNNIT